jgi:hypothetical protein
MEGNPGLIKNRIGEGDVEPCTAVTYGTNVGTVKTMTSNATFAGVADGLGIFNGKRGDIVLSGITPIVAGEAITHGAELCANASGKAVLASGVASPKTIIGVAEESALIDEQFLMKIMVYKA